jgi:hypothetical protein
MPMMADCRPQVNSKSLTPLFAYALTHAHSRSWLSALLTILQRKGGDYA